jgi:eukaryotic-like serine/threonine-protein kinase
MKKGPMNPERWQRIESIFQKALDADSGHRASVLEDSCAGDESLQREVESLLAQHEKASEFIERPAFATSSDGPLPRPRSGDSNAAGIPAGTAIGHYRIVGKIGSGGMGVVYEAEDLKLRRHVALKFLPEEVAEHPQALQRFRLEARAASALNHPNICTIHEVDEVDGRVFIAMELLEGQTLKQTISGKALPLETVIDFGIQIAGAINAAHSKGIVHRDIKPANIFVLKQRRIKVLDFGLAKLTRRESSSGETGMADGTEPGMVMGTVGYMSPEQIRGQAVDGRTDIFAFGAILYEMLAGRRAFERPTSSETMAAILNEEPAAISQVAPTTPLALVRVVKRCLEKDPEQRFQSASDLAFALEALSESSGVTGTDAGEGRPSRRVWAWTAAVAVGAVVALAGLGVVWWRTPPAVPVVESVRMLTDDGEPKPYPGATFTDGSRIYFNEDLSGGWKVVQVSVAGGPTASIDTSLHNIALLGLAPDNSAALVGTGHFQVYVPPTGPLWSIPLPAGEPRRLGNFEATGGAGYFPDGHLVFTQGQDLLVAEADGANPRKLASATGDAYFPSVSPDGRRIVFANDLPAGFSLVEVGSDGKGMRTLDANCSACRAIWTPDGKYLLYQNIDQAEIWAFPMEKTLFRRSSQPIQLTAGPLHYSGLSVSRDGRQVFAIGTTARGELVRYDMKSHQFLPFLSGISAVEPTFSADGKWVAYASYPDRSLWRSRSDGSDKVQLTHPPIVVSIPHISPDGTKVAFTSLHTDDLMVVDMNGGLPPRTIAKGDGVNWNQARNWSPDGNLLLINIKGEIAIYDMRTGKTSVVPSSQDRWGYWIDQNSILGLSPDSAKFLTYDLRTQKWTDLVTVGVDRAWQVSPDGKYVYYETGGEEPKAWRLRFADRKIEMLTSMKEASRARDLGWVGDIDAAPDGSPIFTRDLGTQEIYALNVRWPK